MKHANGDAWRYADTGALVSDEPARDCGLCGLPATGEGHDGCLGQLPHVENACCGHGHDLPYVAICGRSIRRCLRGEQALCWFELWGKGPTMIGSGPRPGAECLASRQRGRGNSSALRASP